MIEMAARSVVVLVFLAVRAVAAEPPGVTPPLATPSSSRFEVMADGVLPIGGMLHGFSMGGGPEAGVVLDDGDGRMLAMGAHLTVHSMGYEGNGPAYVGGLAFERRWGRRSWSGFYWGVRLDGTAAFWNNSRAWGLAPGIVLGGMIPTSASTSVDLSAGLEIPIGSYNITTMVCSGYCSGTYVDLVAGLRAGVSFAAL